MRLVLFAIARNLSRGERGSATTRVCRGDAESRRRESGSVTGNRVHFNLRGVIEIVSDL